MLLELDTINYKQVNFVDGRKGRFAIIVYVMGYPPSLSFIAGIVHILRTDRNPGAQASSGINVLYFIGLDNLRNFLSRYLRGIRDDAKRLASRIKEELQDRQNVTA